MIRRLWWNMGRAVVYFLAGAVMDSLVTWYYVSVDSAQVFLASTLSAAITLFSMLAINGILVSNVSVRAKYTNLLCYATGNAAGTAIVMLLR
jgi:hypothetical protein